MQALRDGSFAVVDGHRHPPEKKTETVAEEIHRRIDREKLRDGEEKKRKLDESAAKSENKTKKSR